MSSTASSSIPEASGHGLLCIATVDARGRAVAAEELADWAEPCRRGAVWCAFGEVDFVAWREVQDPGELITPVDLTTVLSSRTVAVQATGPEHAPPWVSPIDEIVRPGPGWEIGGDPLPLGGLVTLRVHPLVMLARLDHTPRRGVVDEVLRGLLATPPPGAETGELRVAVLRGHEEHELLLWVRSRTLDALEALVGWLRGLPVPEALPYDDDLLRQLAPSAFEPGQDIGWLGLPVFNGVDLTVLMPLAWGPSAPENGRPLLSSRDPRAPEGPPRVAAGPDLALPVSQRPLFLTLTLSYPPSAEASAAALVAAWQSLERVPAAPPLAALRGGQLALPVLQGAADVPVSALLDVLQLTLGDADTLGPLAALPAPLRGRHARAGIAFETHFHLIAPGGPAPLPAGDPAVLADGFRAVLDRKRRACVRDAHSPQADGGLLELWNAESLHAGMPWAFRARVGHLLRRWADGLLADPERHAVALDVLRALHRACLEHRKRRGPTATSRPMLILDGPVGQPTAPLHVDAVLPIVETLEAFLQAEPSHGIRGLRPSPAGSNSPCGRRRSVEIIGGALQVFGAQWGLADHVVMVVDSDDAILQARPIGGRTLLVRLPRGATEDPLMLTLGPTLAFAWMERTPLRLAVRRNAEVQPAIDALLRACESPPALPDASIRAVLEAVQGVLATMAPSPVTRAIGWLILRLPALRLGRRSLRRARERETAGARRRERLLHGPLVVRTCVDSFVRSGHRVQEAAEAGIMALLLSAELGRHPADPQGDWRTRAHRILRFALDNPHFFDPANAIHPIPDAVHSAVQPIVLDMLRAFCEDLGVGPDVMAFAMGRLADDLDGPTWAPAPGSAATRRGNIVDTWLHVVVQLDAVPRPTPADDPLHSAFLDYLDACLPDHSTPRAAGPWPPSLSSASADHGHGTRGFLVSRNLGPSEEGSRTRRCADGRRPICLLRSGGRLRPDGADESWEAAEIAHRDSLLNALAAHGGRPLGAVFVHQEREGS